MLIDSEELKAWLEKRENEEFENSINSKDDFDKMLGHIGRQSAYFNTLVKIEELEAREGKG